MNNALLYERFIAANGVTTDSRNCPDGSLFFALRGDAFNGNAYAAQALEKGCAYAVVDDEAYFIDNGRYLLVDDALHALQQLAKHHRQQMRAKIIGITGTNGKTTTKELIAAVLMQKYSVLYTQGNLNNHIGVPLTLLRLQPEHDIAVIEMGANHPGEIGELAGIVDPDYGIITNVGKAHLEGFGSFEGVVRTKGELYDYLRGRKNSCIFIDDDNEFLMQMAAGLSKITYGTNNSLYVTGKITGNSPFLEFSWKLGPDGDEQQIKTQLIGGYNFKNALAAVAIGCYFGVGNRLINEAISNYRPQNSRSQLKETADNVLIVDAYNANPTSMMAALENFKSMMATHKMLILGDMMELGKDSADEHQRIIDFINTSGFENVILVGALFSATRHNYPVFATVDELIRGFEKHKPSGKTILIKGSNGTKLNRVVDYL